MRTLLVLPLLTACAPQDDALPTADAGPARSGEVGQTFTFSAPLHPGLDLTWRFGALPTGSRLGPQDLLDPHSASPRFSPDVEGVYRLELDACDAWGACTRGQTLALVGEAARRSGGSALRPLAFDLTVLGPLKPDNQAPDAQASASRSRALGGPILLDGSDSSDPDGDSLRFRWSFASLPADSSLRDDDILDADLAQASFRPDVSGDYGLQLRVTDGNWGFDSVVLPEISAYTIWEDLDPIPD